MRMFKFAAAFAVLLASVGANALPVFVGKWQVDQGPSWDPVPASYSGQEAAALLFGGSPLDYVISTIDNVVAHIDFLTWVSVWGDGSGTTVDKVAQDYNGGTAGEYRWPGDMSAYVNDWAVGDTYTNYAFRLVATDTPLNSRSVPEPSVVSLLAIALAGAAVGRRRQRAAQA